MRTSQNGGNTELAAQGTRYARIDEKNEIWYHSNEKILKITVRFLRVFRVYS